jgi:hypothetical protein
MILALDELAAFSAWLPAFLREDVFRPLPDLLNTRVREDTRHPHRATIECIRDFPDNPEYAGFPARVRVIATVAIVYLESAA